MEKRTKRIMHVIDHLGLGGAQTIVKDLVEKNTNHYAFILRSADNEIKFSEKIKKKIFIGKSKSKYSLSPIFEIKSEIESKKIDVLHVHLSKSIFIIYLYKLLFKNNLKVVITEHGAVFSKKRWFYRFLLRRIEKYVTKYIAVSKRIRESLIEDAKLNPKKIEHVYNFIDFKTLEKISQKEKDKIRESIGIKKDDFLIGFVGRLSAVKNVPSFINSYKYYKDKRTKILIIGDGELKSELEELAKDEKNIIFLGFRKDIKKWYQILDLIVLPSKTEASPMAFYESQVYGIPFVGSDVYAINEFIKDENNGLLFEFDNEKELAKKIVMIRDNKTIAKSIKTNATKNLNQFDIKLYNEKLNKIYESD